MMMLPRSSSSLSSAAARLASRQLSRTVSSPPSPQLPLLLRPATHRSAQVSTVARSARASAAVAATGALFYNSACDVHALEVPAARTATTLATAALAGGKEGGGDHRSAASGYPEIILYQYKICPYCNKVKAVLDFLGVPYEALEVNPVSKAEIKGDGFDGYKKVRVSPRPCERVWVQVAVSLQVYHSACMWSSEYTL